MNLGLGGLLKAAGIWASITAALTITEWNSLGLVIVAVVVALFSLRYAERTVYKQNYEAQKARAEEAERERDEQRDAKHEAKTNLASVEMQLKMEKQKTDLSAVLEKLADVQNRDEALILALRAMENRLLAAYTEQNSILGEIAEQLRGGKQGRRSQGGPPSRQPGEGA